MTIVFDYHYDYDCDWYHHDYHDDDCVHESYHDYSYDYYDEYGYYNYHCYYVNDNTLRESILHNHENNRQQQNHSNDED